MAEVILNKDTITELCDVLREKSQFIPRTTISCLPLMAKNALVTNKNGKQCWCEGINETSTAIPHPMTYTCMLENNVTTINGWVEGGDYSLEGFPTIQVDFSFSECSFYEGASRHALYLVLNYENAGGEGADAQGTLESKIHFKINFNNLSLNSSGAATLTTDDGTPMSVRTIFGSWLDELAPITGPITITASFDNEIEHGEGYYYQTMVQPKIAIYGHQEIQSISNEIATYYRPGASNKIQQKEQDGFKWEIWDLGHTIQSGWYIIDKLEEEKIYKNIEFYLDTRNNSYIYEKISLPLNESVQFVCQSQGDNSKLYTLQMVLSQDGTLVITAQERGTNFHDSYTISQSTEAQDFYTLMQTEKSARDFEMYMFCP